MTTSTDAVTREAAEFIRRTGFDQIPAEAVRIAGRCIQDGLGMILAGSDEACARTVRSYVLSVQGRGESSILGKQRAMAPAHLAALANGTAGHALDWDDTALSREADRSVLLHPTMQPLSAALALGESGAASGKLILTAFVVGFEIESKIAESIFAEHFTGGRGFHTSNTIGIFGSTAAACKILDLPVDAVINALGIAASMSSGIGVNHGTMGKPLQMGRAAENGVTAARLAKFGLTASPVALEGPRGFFQCFGGGYHPEKICGRFGTPFSILDPGVSVKPYPCGVVGHPGMDAMKQLAENNDISPGEVDHVVVATGSNVLPPKGPLRFPKANSALEAKFCLPFQIAAMILRRKAGLMEFSDDFVQLPEVQEMMGRIETTVDPQIDAMGRDKLVFKITVRLKSGESFSRVSEGAYRGGPDNPLSTRELREKFIDAAQRVLDPSRIDDILDMLADLEAIENIRSLVNLIGAAPAPRH